MQNNGDTAFKKKASQNFSVTSHQGVVKVVGLLPALRTDDSVKVILPGTSMSNRWIFLD